jgi:hypothetical protein
MDFKVMDSCCTTPCETTSNIAKWITELNSVAGNDGIHFTAANYKNLANRTIGCLKTLLAAPQRISKQSTYFWRGFRSRRGSSLPRTFSGPVSPDGSNRTCGHSRGRTRGRLVEQPVKRFPSVPQMVDNKSHCYFYAAEMMKKLLCENKNYNNNCKVVQ